MKELIAVSEVHDCEGCIFEKQFTGSVCNNDDQIINNKQINCAIKGIIYKYDELLELKVTEPESINFYIGHDVCGTLYKEDGVMKFKGNLDKSAKALFDYVCKIWNEED